SEQRNRAAEVESFTRCARCTRRQLLHCEKYSGDSNRDVHIENRAPSDVVGEKPAQQRPDNRRRRKHRSHHAKRAASFRRRKHLGHYSGAVRQERSRSDPLKTSERNQQPDVWRSSAQRGTNRENDKAKDVQSLSPVNVGGSAKDDHQSGEHQQIRSDNPLDDGKVSLKVSRESGKGDVYDARI